MSKQRSALRFRIPSWFAPASPSPSQAPATKSPSQPTTNSAPTSQTNNTSPAAPQLPRPSDNAPPASTTASKPPLGSTGKTAQNNNTMSQTSKTESHVKPRKSAQSHIDQPASPARSNSHVQALPKQSTPSRAASRPKVKSTPPTSTRASPQRSSTNATATEPQSEPNKGHELKPTNEDTQPSSSKKSSQPVTSESSQLPSTSSTEATSTYEREPIATSFSSQALSGTSSQRNGSATELEKPITAPSPVSTNQGDPEPHIPTRTSNSADMNHQLEPNEKSDLTPEVKKEVAEIVLEEKNRDQEEPTQVPMRNIQYNKAPSQPGHRDMTGHSYQEPATYEGESIPLHKVIKNDLSKFLHRKPAGDPRYARDERPVSVITLAGENRGASMQLNSESLHKERPLHILRSYKLNAEESNEATADGEGTSRKIGPGNQNSIEDQAKVMYINSNIQSINNSILFNSSITHRNPGVHLVWFRTSTEHIKPTNRKEPNTHKAEYNITQAHKFTYEPTVRRRCLRGLLLESSDSEPDNPEKKRRHGCRVGCNETNQSNKIDIL